MKKNSIFFKKDIKGMIIKTKYLPYQNKRDAMAKASHKRDSNKTYSKSIRWNSDIDAIDNYYNACLALLKEWELKEYNDNLEVLAIGYDHDYHYFIVNKKEF